MYDYKRIVASAQVTMPFFSRIRIFIKGQPRDSNLCTVLLGQRIKINKTVSENICEHLERKLNIFQVESASHRVRE